MATLVVDESRFHGLPADKWEETYARLGVLVNAASESFGFDIEYPDCLWSTELSPGKLFCEVLWADLLRDTGVLVQTVLDRGSFATNVPLPAIMLRESEQRASYGILRALDLALQGLEVGVADVLGPSSQLLAIKVSSDSRSHEIPFVSNVRLLPPFVRWLMLKFDWTEAAFTSRWKMAFPDLTFSDDVAGQFGKLQGSFIDLKPDTLKHLAALNDGFMRIDAESSNDKEISTKLNSEFGVDVSRESSKTRKSDALMKQRIAKLAGKDYLCEWHSKIEPHQNRIHFCPIRGGPKGDYVLIGLFHKHLDT